MTARFEGGSELKAALLKLVDQTGKTTQGKAAMGRAAAKALIPTRDTAKRLAPKLTGDLEESIIIGTRLTRRQARMAKKVGKSAVERHVGTANPAGIPQEFGTFKEPAQPFMGPAWDQTQDEALGILGAEAWKEIEKTARRVARKAARLK